MLVKSKIKYIQTLGQKKFREQEGLFIAEGPKIVKELLLAPAVNVKQVYALKEWIQENTNVLGNTETIEITGIELEKVSQLTTPNKVIALVQQFDMTIAGAGRNKITLVLDDLQDPGNLGSIIRIADWFGVEQIICSPHSADIYSHKVVQSTMGSISRVRVFYTDLDQWLAGQKEVPIYATTMEGQDVTAMKKIREGIIIIGNESKGVHPSLLSFAREKITIPQKGRAESLNAAVAAGIVLSHLV